MKRGSDMFLSFSPFDLKHVLRFLGCFLNLKMIFKKSFSETGCPSLCPTSCTWTPDKDVMAFRKQHIRQRAAPSRTKGWIHECNINRGNVPPLPLPGFWLNLLKQLIVTGFCSLWCSSADQYVLDMLMAPNLNETAQGSQEFELRLWVTFWGLFLIRSNTKLLPKKRWEAVLAARKGKRAVNYSQFWLGSHTAAPLQNFPRPGDAGYPFDRNLVFVNSVCSAWHDI